MVKCNLCLGNIVGHVHRGDSGQTYHKECLELSASIFKVNGPKGRETVRDKMRELIIKLRKKRSKYEEYKRKLGHSWESEVRSLYPESISESH